MVIRKPQYYDTFRCAAGACPDSCCHQWEVQVDADAAERYRALPGPLGDDLREVLRTEDGETFMTLREGKCPMWRSDGLCRIQAELGETALCRVCREFPRLRHDYGGFQELMLEMSCPEAAKWIFMDEVGWVETEIPGGSEAEYDREAMALLLASREEAMALLDGEALPEEALAKLLLLGVRAQNALDGGDAGEIRMEEAMAYSIREYPHEDLPWHEEYLPAEPDAPLGAFYDGCYRCFTHTGDPLVPIAETRRLVRAIDAAQAMCYPSNPQGKPGNCIS